MLSRLFCWRREIYKEYNDTVGIADAYSIIATSYYKKGDLTKAENYWKKAISLYEKKNKVFKVSYNEHNLGLLYYEDGNYDEALRLFNNTLQKTICRKLSA